MCLFHFFLFYFIFFFALFSLVVIVSGRRVWPEEQEAYQKWKISFGPLIVLPPDAEIHQEKDPNHWTPVQKRAVMFQP